jgi:endonuclease III
MSNLLVQIAKKRFDNPESQVVHFVDDDEANRILNDLDRYSHAYVLACLMDRQIKAERAWKVPLEIFKGFGTLEIVDLATIPISDLTSVFSKNKLHRFNETMAEVFYRGVEDISNKYDGDASKIW